MSKTKHKSNFLSGKLIIGAILLIPLIIAFSMPNENNGRRPTVTAPAEVCSDLPILLHVETYDQYGDPIESGKIEVADYEGNYVTNITKNDFIIKNGQEYSVHIEKDGYWSEDITLKYCERSEPNMTIKINNTVYNNTLVLLYYERVNTELLPKKKLYFYIDKMDNLHIQNPNPRTVTVYIYGKDDRISRDVQSYGECVIHPKFKINYIEYYLEYDYYMVKLFEDTGEWKTYNYKNIGVIE